MAVCQCLGQSMESLVAQSLATGKMKLCGHHLNRTMIMWTLAFLLLSPMAVFYRYVLSAFGYDDKTLFVVTQYLVCLLPGLFTFGLCDLYRRFFICFNNSKTPMACYVSTLIFYPLILHLFIEKHEMKLMGIAAASLLSYLMTFAQLRVMFAKCSEMHETNVSPSAQTLYGFNQYLFQALFPLGTSVLDLASW